MKNNAVQIPKHLIIATATPHYWWQNKLWGFGPYSKEIDILAPIFNKITILSPLLNAEPPKTYLTFKTKYITHKPLPNVGGKHLYNKILGLLTLPKSIYILCTNVGKNDGLMARCPSSFGLIATLIGPLLTKFRIAKYAGQWNGYKEEPFSVTMQRKILSSSWWSAPVTVYGQWDNQPKHIIAFFTSMMNNAQMKDAIKSFESKKNNNQFIRNKRPLKILFSGRLAPEKNISQLLKALAILKNKKLSFECKIIGSGPLKDDLMQESQTLGIFQYITFINGLHYNQCLKQNAWADCLVLPSTHSEGWPKVIAEAMAYGVICIGVDHGQVAKMLEHGGICLKNGTDIEIAQALEDVYQNSDKFLTHREKASKWSRQYTTEGLYIKNKELIKKWWANND